MMVWIVIKEGPEWAEIEGVFATQSAATAYAEKLDAAPPADIFDKLSHYVVSPWTVREA